MHPLLITFIIALGLNLVMFFPAYLFKTDKLTDISYAVTFTLVALYGLFSNTVTLPQLILFAMIFIWAVRLGSYLLIRIHRIGKDKRFDGRREQFGSFLRFWILQGLAVFIILIPTVFYQDSETNQFSGLSIIGVVIWLLGLLIETFADQQKFTFMNQPENKGRWVNRGLWKYSRHPNYLGEIMVWSGIYLYILPPLTLGEAFIGFISPLFITSLLLFVSGIPMLEKAAENKWGDDPEWQSYKRNTGSLFPRFK